MPLWGNTKTANSAPKDHILPTSNARGNTIFANTTPNAIVPGQAVGIFAISRQDIMQNEGGRLPGVSGWYLARYGTGPVLSVTVNGTGSNNYSNNDLVKVTGGSVNALGNIVTNATGGMVSVALMKNGSGFTNAASLSVVVSNSTYGTSNGTGGSLSVVLGGRAGRRMNECIAAVKRMANTPSTTI